MEWYEEWKRIRQELIDDHENLDEEDRIIMAKEYKPGDEDRNLPDEELEEQWATEAEMDSIPSEPPYQCWIDDFDTIENNTAIEQYEKIEEMWEMSPSQIEPIYRYKTAQMIISGKLSFEDRLELFFNLNKHYPNSGPIEQLREWAEGFDSGVLSDTKKIADIVIHVLGSDDDIDYWRAKNIDWGDV